MERYSLTRGRSFFEESELEEQAFHGVLYRLHGNPPNVLSNYHLVLPHAPPSPPSCRSNCRPPSLSFIPSSTRRNNRTRTRRKRVQSGWSLPVLFLTTYGTSMRPCASHLHALGLLEGRHGTFNSLFKGMKNSGEEKERAAALWQFPSSLYFPLQLFHRLIYISLVGDVPIRNYRYTIVEHPRQKFHC